MFIPKISVVMSVFNDEKFIVESIKSILNQTFKDFEFIIINDCSTDKTLEIIKFYQAKDDRIVLINNKKNLGLTKNLNEWLKIAKGKYIARMDGDDISFPNRLEIEYKYLEKNREIFLVGGGAKIIDENWNYKNDYNPICNISKILKRLEKSNCIYHPSIMFKNEGYFYRDKFSYSQDYDFYLLLLTEWKKIINIPNKLIKYRINSNSISWSKNSKQRLFKEKIKKFYWQRKTTGKDNYSSFDNKKILNIDIENSTNKTVLEGEIIASFKLNNVKRMKSFCKKYFKYYWFLNRYLIYYILSFLLKERV